MRILIAGAGLGGLTSAIALARGGHTVEVFEAAARIEETGAGLTLGLGAQHVFRDLGLQEEVAALACPAGALPFVHFRSGAVLMGAHDQGDGTPDDGTGNLVRHIYRADLQAVLLGAAQAAGARLRTSKKVIGFAQERREVTVTFVDGSKADGDLLVGADGVRSAVRAQLFPGDAPRFAGHVAYRFLVPGAAAAPFMGLGRSAIWIGPGRTFNRYTMCAGRVVNCAGLVETDERIAEGWSIAAGREEVRAAFAGWHPDVIGLIDQAEAIIKWGLYDRSPLPTWSHGRVTLLGDAAHAMLPFLGMGAAMAIEDGWALARALSVEPDLGAALARYEAARIPRTAQVHARSREQGKLTQALDPDRFALAAAPVNDRTMMEFDPVAEGI